MRSSYTLLSILATFSLALALPTSSLAQTSARASLLEADKAASMAVFQKGLMSGLQDFLTDDAILLYEGAPIVAGRGRVIQVLGSQPRLGQLKIQRLPVIVAISEDGNYGTTSGASIIGRVGQAPDSTHEYGHYIAVWRRSGEGTPWKVVAIVENGLAGSDSVTVPAGLDRAPPPLITGPARAFADADVAFAKMAADSGAHAAFGNYAAPDATTPPGESEMTVGATAIRARMSNPARMQALWSWHPVYAGSSTGGDFGYTVGEATIRSSSATDASVYQGKYLTVWQKQPDGSIKFILDSGNAR